MYLKQLKYMLLALALSLASIQTVFSAGAHEGEQFYPLFTYRTGVYANVGTTTVGGQRDLLTYQNETDGGVDGVRHHMLECETSYDIDKGIECFDRHINGNQGAPTATISSMSSGLFAATQQRNREHKVPHMIPGGGTATAIDGRFNEYQFSVMFDYWRQSQIVVEYIAQRLGGHDKLKGQVIVTLYHDSGYGRETIEPMKILSKQYGFKDVQISVPHPGVQQDGQWKQIRSVKADWVYLRTWGAQTPASITTAKRTGFPVDHIIGDIWATSEDDVRPAGDAAIGYTGVNIFPPGEFEIHKRIKKTLYDDSDKGDLKDFERFGTVYYNWGLITTLVYSEMLRTAHKEFGNRPISGEEARWAYENLDIDQKRLEELGVVGLLSPLKLSRCNHQGEKILAKVIQWKGKGWDSTDWIEIDTQMFVPTFTAKAEAIAKEQGVPKRDLPECEVSLIDTYNRLEHKRFS